MFYEKLLGYFCDKDSRRFCWWLPGLAELWIAAPQPVEGVLRMQNSREVVELYGRFGPE